MGPKTGVWEEQTTSPQGHALNFCEILVTSLGMPFVSAAKQYRTSLGQHIQTGTTG